MREVASLTSRSGIYFIFCLSLWDHCCMFLCGASSGLSSCLPIMQYAGCYGTLSEHGPLPHWSQHGLSCSRWMPPPHSLWTNAGFLLFYNKELSICFAYAWGNILDPMTLSDTKREKGNDSAKQLLPQYNLCGKSSLCATYSSPINFKEMVLIIKNNYIVVVLFLKTLYLYLSHTFTHRSQLE